MYLREKAERALHEYVLLLQIVDLLFERFLQTYELCCDFLETSNIHFFIERGNVLLFVKAVKKVFI